MKQPVERSWRAKNLLATGISQWNAKTMDFRAINLHLIIDQVTAMIDVHLVIRIMVHRRVTTKKEVDTNAKMIEMSGCITNKSQNVIMKRDAERTSIVRKDAGRKSIGKKGTGIRNIDTRRVAKSLENIIRNEHIKMNSIPADTIGRVSENQLDRTTSRCKNTRSEDSADPLTLNVSLRLI